MEHTANGDEVGREYTQGGQCYESAKGRRAGNVENGQYHDDEDGEPQGADRDAMFWTDLPS